VVANVTGVKAIHELERAVIDRQAQKAHVVGVHHAVTKAHRLPLREQAGGALLHLVQQGRVNVALPQCGALLALGQVVADRVVGQSAQAVGIALRRKMLKVAKS
jgi:hypothetical protein